MSDIRFNRWLHNSGTGGVYQDSAGNVGVGTSVPRASIDIAVGAASSIRVGSAVTISHSGGFQVGSSSLHSSGLNVTSINSTGVVTATTFSGNLIGNVTGTVNSSGISTFTNLVVSAGSTSAPSISPTGDSNTGIFFPSPDTIAFTEGGVEALRVDSSSNIGIGTTGTGDKLTVLGRVQIQQDSGSNNRLILRGQPGSTYRWNIDNNGSSNDLRIFREDDVTTAGGLVYASLSSSGNFTLNNGNLVIGTAGKGIDFSATANSSGTMTSELLSDYEEGTWTPSIGGNATYTTQQGTYVKIGKIVYVNFYITINVKGTGGNSITGLPFASISQTGGGCANYWFGAASAVCTIGVYTFNSSQFDLYSNTAANNSLGSNTIFQNGTTLQASVVYQTSS